MTTRYNIRCESTNVGANSMSCMFYYNQQLVVPTNYVNYGIVQHTNRVAWMCMCTRRRRLFIPNPSPYK